MCVRILRTAQQDPTIHMYIFIIIYICFANPYSYFCDVLQNILYPVCSAFSLMLFTKFIFCAPLRLHSLIHRHKYKCRPLHMFHSHHSHVYLSIVSNNMFWPLFHRQWSIPRIVFRSSHQRCRNTYNLQLNH